MTGLADRSRPADDRDGAAAAWRDSGGRDDGGAVLTIGLVNNMPDAAVGKTESQFRTLLQDGSGRMPVRLRLFSLPGLHRGAASRAHMARSYEPIAALRDDPVDGLPVDGLPVDGLPVDGLPVDGLPVDGLPVDGLIVTGAEPRAPDLRAEPFWPALAQLIDWTASHKIPAIWSCLAAHAAVLHADGLVRRPLGFKLSGLFDCVRACDDDIMAGVPARWIVPHSRYNDLAEADLTGAGYRILARSRDAGVDAFAADRGVLSLYLQGHPEYDRKALLLEYRRDIGLFLSGKRATYPEMPHNYFGPAAISALDAFRERAERTPASSMLAAFPAAAAERGLAHDWHAPAVILYRNWLGYLAQRKGAGLRQA